MRKINFLPLLLWLCSTTSLFAQKTAEEWAAKAAATREKHHQLTYYTQAWYADKQNPKYLYALAQVKYDLARYQEAINDLDSVIVRKPRSCEGASLLDLRGRCLARLKKPEQAVKDWNRIIRECPGYANARTLLADLYLEKKTYDSCLIYAVEALKLSPTDDRALLIQAKAQSAKGNQEQAVRLATQAIGLNKAYKNPALYVRGEAYRKQGSTDLAFADLNPLAEPDALFAAGEILFERGEYLKARMKYDNALLQRPNFPEAAERRKEAIRKLKGSKEQVPSKPDAVADTGPKRTGCILAKVPPPAQRKHYMALNFSGASLPSSVDLSEYMPAVRDQGLQGSCAAFTLAYLAHCHDKKETGKSTVFSPAFLYNQKHLRGMGGMMLDEALTFWKTNGICPEADMRYQFRDSLTQPTPVVSRKAKKYRITRFDAIYDLMDLKSTLNAKNPVILGIGVDRSFADYKGGVWGGPKSRGIGGHAMLVVGYDDSKQAIKVINSWSEEWGENGYGWIAYDYVNNMVSNGQANLFSTLDAKNAAEYDEEEANDQDNNKDIVQPGQEQDNGLWIEFLEALLGGDDYYATSGVALTGVAHNQGCNFTNGMYISGTVNVPAYAGYNCQIVVYFYNAYTGQPVGGFYPFATYTGQVATSTQQVSLPIYGMSNTWQVCIPYSAFNLYPGRTDLYGIPVLYIDNYGVAQGQRFDFWVVR